MTFKKYKKKILEDPRSKKLNFVVDGRIHYVYRVSKDNKHYYGSRTDKDEPTIGRGYYTSSKYLGPNFKANPENYKVKVIRSFGSRTEAITFESFLHQKFDVKNHDNFINRSNQLPWGFDNLGLFLGSNSPVARSVCKIDQNTGLIIEQFGSVGEAEDEIGVGNVSIALLSIYKTAGGFVWLDTGKYSEEIRAKIINYNYSRKKPVGWVDQETGLIMESFSSVEEAQKKFCGCSIAHAAQGFAFTACGKVWVYLEEYTEKEKQKVIDFDYDSLRKKAILLINENTGVIVKRFSFVEEAKEAGYGGDILCCVLRNKKDVLRPSRAGGKVFIYKEDYTLEFSQKVKDYNFEDPNARALYQLKGNTREIIKEWSSLKLAQATASRGEIRFTLEGKTKLTDGCGWVWKDKY